MTTMTPGTRLPIATAIFQNSTGYTCLVCPVCRTQTVQQTGMQDHPPGSARLAERLDVKYICGKPGDTVRHRFTREIWTDNRTTGAVVYDGEADEEEQRR